MGDLATKWRLYWFFKSAGITRKINGLFFYLRKIPFIGKQISVTIYQNYEIKKVLFVIGTVIEVLLKVAMKFVWFGLHCGLMAFVSSIVALPKGVGIVESALVLWLFTVPLLVGAIDGFMQRLAQQDADFIANFQVSNKSYVHSRMLVETLHDGLSYLPVMLVVGIILGRPLTIPLVALFSYLGGLFFFYYLGRCISTFHTTGRLILNGVGFVVVVLSFFWVANQGLFLPIYSWYFSWFGVVLSLVMLMLSSWLLFTYKGEERYNYWLIERSIGQLEAMQKAKSGNSTYLGEGLKMQKELKLIEGEQTHLEGNQYLNSLLFSRYRPTLTRQLYYRLAGIIVVGLLVSVISFFAKGPRFSEAQVIAMLPVLFFVMYLLTFGKKVVQMVFINCDSSMLFYPFYREPKTILQGFYYRFWQTFYYNGLLSVAIFLMAILINGANHFFLSLTFFAILAFLLLSLSFLFSFHELFVYYLLQPFSSDLEVVNPLYKGAAGILYGVAYLNLQVRSTGVLYVLVVSILSLIYVVIGVIIVWRVAPKTFRFKG